MTAEKTGSSKKPKTADFLQLFQVNFVGILNAVTLHQQRKPLAKFVDNDTIKIIYREKRNIVYAVHRTTEPN